MIWKFRFFKSTDLWLPTKILGLSLLTSACGSGTVMTNPPNKSGGELRIRAEVNELGNDRVEVLARPSVQVNSGSFFYCLSSIENCKRNPSAQIKMMPVEDVAATEGAPTIASHKVPQILDTNQVQRISISATEFSSSRVMWISVNLASAPSEDDEPTETESHFTPPVTTALDKFQFDRAAFERSGQRLTGIDFDYKYAQANLHPTQPKLRAKLTNQSLLALKNNLGVVMGGYALKDSSKFITLHTAATVDSQGFLNLSGDNLESATIYKMRLHFYDRTDRSQSQPRYLGSSSRTYHFVTDGVQDSESKIRSRLVMRGLAEESDWDLNRYDRSKNYTHGAGGWCHIFYNWVITPYLKTRSGSENTHYSQSYWSNLGAVKNGAALVEMSQREPIMGDYFRVGSHAAMILAYDVAKRQFVTLEGNFNNSVEFYQRSAGNISWVGHIIPQMLKETALQGIQN